MMTISNHAKLSAVLSAGVFLWVSSVEVAAVRAARTDASVTVLFENRDGHLRPVVFTTSVTAPRRAPKQVQQRSNVAGAGCLFVDDSATSGANDGTSWCDAFLDLQDALLAAADMAIPCIKVAQGAYVPKSVTSDARECAFDPFPMEDFSLLGGYAGCGAENPDARDPEVFETKLSGDRGMPNDDSDNCYCVVKAKPVSAGLIEGFTIERGKGDAPIASLDNYSGGCACFFGSPTLRSIRFTRCSARIGGCLFLQGDGNDFSPLVTKSRFEECSAGQGSALFIGARDATISYSSFAHNTADGTLLSASSFGTGAVAVAAGNVQGSVYKPTVKYSDFYGNFADLGGGVYSIGSPVFDHCKWRNNVGELIGGGVFAFSYPGFNPDDENEITGQVSMVNNTMMDNAAQANGAVFCAECDFTMTNSIAWGNTGNTEGGGVDPQIGLFASNAVLNTNIVEGALEGGVFEGNGNRNVEPGLTADGHLRAGSAAINAGDSSVVANTAAGEAETDADGDPVIVGGLVDIGADEFLTPTAMHCPISGRSGLPPRRRPPVSEGG